jgi:FkbM family methyltransferase
MPWMISSRKKIALARAAYRGIMLARRVVGLGSQVSVTRDGLRWELDLQEGIDLAIYLFGMFERETVMACRRWIKPGDVVFDIGANVGAHTLQCAGRVGESGKVVAFEPTQYAYIKLKRNVACNPQLRGRVVAEQILLGEKHGEKVPALLYSSWPLMGKMSVHHKHCGRLMGTEGAEATSLDNYVERSGIKRVGFIKLDVDGHECGVLRGGSALLRRDRPVMVMEIAPYVLAEAGSSLEELCAILSNQKYRLAELATARPLSLDHLKLGQMIPDGCGVNVLALPL